MLKCERYFLSRLFFENFDFCLKTPRRTDAGARVEFLDEASKETSNGVGGGGGERRTTPELTPTNKKNEKI